MQKLELNYFYGTQADSFTFYRIPKILITEEAFRELSNDAKMLYGLMLDRMGLSSKNNWFDEENRVFVYYSMEDVMDDLNCSKNKALKSLSELDTETGIGLIERVKQGQGKPAKIYVKNFLTAEGIGSDFPKKEVKSTQKGNSRVPEKGCLEDPKKDPNNININNTEYNNTESNLILSAENVDNSSKENKRSDTMDEIDVNAYARYIWDKLDMDIMLERYPADRDVLNGIYELIVETVVNQSDTFVIASNKYPMNLVRSKFMKLNSSHVEYVMDCLLSNTTKVCNIKKYILAALFNAPTTMGGYFRAEVNHDMPQLAKAR